MTRTRIAPDWGNSGRASLSGPGVERPDADSGNEVELDIADTKEIAHALIDSKDTDCFLLVTPA